MKVYRSKIEPLAKDIIGTLNAARDIEVAPGQVAEAELDVRAILDQYVKVEDTIKGFKEILEGKCDDMPEQAFYMVGTIEQAREKAKSMAAAA